MRSAKDYMKRIYSMPLGAILSWFLFSTFAVSAFADHRAEFLDRIEADATTRATLERALEDFLSVLGYPSSLPRYRVCLIGCLDQ